MTLSEAISYYEQTQPRGEFVLVIEGAPEKRAEETELSIEEHVQKYIDGGMTKMDAIKAAASDRGASKRDIYNDYHKELK